MRYFMLLCLSGTLFGAPIHADPVTSNYGAAVSRNFHDGGVLSPLSGNPVNGRYGATDPKPGPREARLNLLLRRIFSSDAETVLALEDVAPANPGTDLLRDGSAASADTQPGDGDQPRQPGRRFNWLSDFSVSNTLGLKLRF